MRFIHFAYTNTILYNCAFTNNSIGVYNYAKTIMT